MQEQSDHTDIDLFRQLDVNPEKALKDISHVYKRKLYLRIYRIVRDMELTKEIFSDILLALWQDKSKIAKMDFPVRYMYVIAYHRSLRVAAEKGKRQTGSLQELLKMQSPDNAEDILFVNDLYRQIKLAQKGLTTRENEVFELSVFSRLEKKEIAEKLNISEITVRNHLSSAMKQIQAHLGKLTGLFLV
jgi:RNA polymerase sigma-70 factor (ECF subfamily)